MFQNRIIPFNISTNRYEEIYDIKNTLAVKSSSGLCFVG